ncbi:MAG: YihY/virulence factor BrkB family protein, partial [Leptospiraceae bacterium]|nr:YihY/virulence factor BrkB family protein [Leptospiraceae bacterium]
MPVKKALHILDLLESAFRRFLRDGLIIRANAVAYAAVLALIPALAMLVKFASIDRASLQIQIARLLAAYGITESGRVLVMLDEILARANAIAGVGTIFVLYSANNLIRHLEDAFNHVFRAPDRPILFRFAIYIASFVILPALLLGASGLYRQTVAGLSPPAFVDLTFREGTLYLLESNGTLEERSIEGVRVRRILDQLNLEAPFRERIYDPGSRRILNRISPDSSLTPLDRPTLSEVQEFSDLRIDGSFFLVSTESGLLVFSEDQGLTWDYRRYLVKTESALRNAFIEDVILLPDRIVMLTGDGLQSTLLVLNRSDLSIIDMNPLESAYRSLNQLPDGLYAGGNGKYRVSRDGGFSWSQPINASFGNRNELIQSIHKNARGDLVFMARSGVLWLHTPEGERLYPSLFESGSAGQGGLMLGTTGPAFLYGADGM